MNRLKLIEPTKEYEDQVMAYREILIKNGESANGGVLENEVPDEASLGKSGVVQRYWIYFRS